MSTLKTHNLQSPDASSVNIALAPNAGMVVTGIATFNNAVSVGNSVTATAFYGDGTNLTGVDAATLKFGGVTKAQANAAGVVVTGILTATSFKGDGSQLSNLPASAPVGGSSSNKVFFENDKVVSVNYQITSTKNAMTAGPVSVNAGIAVTVPSGCSWTIV
tara:strand:- start:1673 stop:2155 length:483 start_codon:yes stop_codon:yes gene_type:complete